MIVAELIAQLGVKIKAGEWADAKAAIEGMGAVFEKTFGAIDKGIRMMVDAINDVADKGDELGRIAATLDMGTDALQSWGGAAQIIADMSFSDLTDRMKYLQKSISDAASGNAELQASFQGINLKQANGQLRSTDDIMMDLAAKFHAMPDAANRTREAMKLFGRGGAQMGLLLGQGVDAIGKARTEFLASGAAMSQDQVEASDEMSKANWRLAWSQTALSNAFSNPEAIKALAKFKEALAKMVGSKAVQKFLDSMGKAFAYVTTQITGLMEAVNEWLSQGNRMEQFANLMIATLQGIGIAAGLLFTYLGAKGLMLALVNPLTYGVLAVIAGVALLILAFDDIKSYVEGRDSVLGRLIEWSKDTDPSDNAVVRLLKATLGLLNDIKYIHGDQLVWFDNGALTTTEKILQSIVGIFKEIGYWMGIMKPGKDLSDLAYEADLKANPIQYGAPKLGPTIGGSFAGFKPMTTESLNATPPELVASPWRPGVTPEATKQLTANNTFNITGTNAVDIAAEVERRQQAEYDAAWNALSPGGR